MPNYTDYLFNFRYVWSIAVCLECQVPRVTVGALTVSRCRADRARADPDGTRAETRFRLSPKRMSPFKSAGESVQSTAGSRGVCISVSNVGYTTFRGRVRVLATHSIRQFPLHFPSRVPPHTERSLRNQGPAIGCTAPTKNLAAPARNLQSIKDNMLINLLRNIRYPTASTCYLYTTAQVGKTETPSRTQFYYTLLTKNQRHRHKQWRNMATESHRGN